MTYRSEILTRIELNGTQIFADIAQITSFINLKNPDKLRLSASKKEIPIQLR